MGDKAYRKVIEATELVLGIKASRQEDKAMELEEDTKDFKNWVHNTALANACTNTKSYQEYNNCSLQAYTQFESQVNQEKGKKWRWGRFIWSTTTPEYKLSRWSFNSVVYYIFVII